MITLLKTNLYYIRKACRMMTLMPSRIERLESPQNMMSDFLGGHLDLATFKSYIDSFNIQYNYWGFTSIKGQMFFNLLLKTSESDIQTQKLTALIKDCIKEPRDLEAALNKIEVLEKYASTIFNKAPDKRKAPNPGSIGYFLSYFWQIHNPQKWPAMYRSIS